MPGSSDHPRLEDRQMEAASSGFSTPLSLLERLRQPPSQAQQAWSQFVHLYTPLFFAWTRRLGLSEPDAADLVQEVLLSLVHKLPDYCSQRHPSFRSWL